MSVGEGKWIHYRGSVTNKVIQYIFILSSERNVTMLQCKYMKVKIKTKLNVSFDKSSTDLVLSRISTNPEKNSWLLRNTTFYTRANLLVQIVKYHQNCSFIDIDKKPCGCLTLWQQQGSVLWTANLLSSKYVHDLFGAVYNVLCTVCSVHCTVYSL